MKIKNRWSYAAVGVAVLLFAGMVYAWSVLSEPIGREFADWSKAQLSMTFTIVMILFCVGCMAGGFLAAKVSAKVYVWVSAAMFLAGFFLSSRIQTLVGLYVSFGVVCGFASGLAYSAVMGTVGKWFPDKQGLISGVLLMGFGISSFLVGKIYQVLTPETVGAWRRSFLVMGVVTAAVLAVCGFFLEKPGADFVPPAAAARKKSFVNPVTMETPAAVMVKRPAFWLYYLWAVLLSAAGLALVSQASGIAREVGPEVSAGTIATVVGLISVFNGIGRVIMGLVFDRAGRGAAMQIVNALFILTGVVLAVALKTGSFAVLAAGFIIGGLAYGGVTPTNSAFVSSYYGMRNYPRNFSIVNTNLIAASFGSAIAGALYDATKSYMMIYLMICALAVLGILASLAIGSCDRKMLMKKK